LEEPLFSDIAYNRFFAEEKLTGARCRNCGARFVPPRPICTNCFSSTFEWLELSGKGKLAAFTCIYIPPPSMAAQGYDRKHPYCVGIVELDEGGRVDARIEGVDATNPESIKIGTPMKAKFLHRTVDEKPESYLAFEPA
jgi:uncharacterized OB-fold protein